MELREYILEEKNIYLAIYAVKSYVFDYELLSLKDKELFNSLVDPFNEEQINKTIKRVKEILNKILDDENYLFETQVYFKPKEYIKTEAVYRPIHTAKLEQLIAMVALLHPLIYEIPNKKTNWKLNLSNYSRLIPNNFFGNRVSKRPEELFKKWNDQYKKYTQMANEYFKTYHESNEYKYELKLDLKNFFPSVDPLVVYGILMENRPITMKDENDIAVFKNIIYKLLVCKVTNLNTDLAKEKYYGTSNIANNYTRGIAQGLPQSYFFGNICMIKISEIFEEKYAGKSVYYVDDSYIYTNEYIENDDDFKDQLGILNQQIEKMVKKFKDNIVEDAFIFQRKKYYEFYNSLCEGGTPYNIEVHKEGKSTYTRIQNVKDGEIYLRTLSREASQIGSDIMSTYSEQEDETMLCRTQALLQSIEVERKGDLSDRKAYADKLERYYKFFKYREIKLRLKTEKTLNRNIFRVLVDEIGDDEQFEGYNWLERGLGKEKFFHVYKHDIWQVALGILILNTVFEHDKIKNYIKGIIKIAYPRELIQNSYIGRIYEDYLKDKVVRNTPDYYASLNKQTNKKMIHFANLHSNILKKEFTGVRLKGLEDDVLSSYGICKENFLETCKIVNMNSNRLQRMFLNAVYSKIFKVNLSEDVVLSSYDKKGITYGELRLLVFLRNPRCDIQQFFKWKLDVMSGDNLQNVDYTIFEVLGAYRRYVNSPENVDDLIVIHKYTCDVWKNGAKHLYFYTLHNQEHAVDLVKNIIKIVKTFSYLKVRSYDYYILFIACYLHDISMVRIASPNDFLLDNEDSGMIVTELEEKWGACNNIGDTKKVIVDTYKALDTFFEAKIRSKHARDSAVEIRRRKELDFLEPSVRESVAEIAESHMMDVKDVYFLKGEARKKLISSKFDIILLRFADLLDMSEHRVSKPILNHNIDNMSPVSAFHWVSHLLTEGYELKSDYVRNESETSVENLSPNSIKERVILSIYVKLSQFSKTEACGCECGKINEDSINGEGFEILLNDDNKICTSDKCNFLCKWFNNKNYYLIKEMQALEAYLLRVPKTERFYNTEIVIRVVVSNPTDISDEQFELLKRNIT